MHSTNNDQTFWREAFAIQGSITPRVMPYVLVCGVFACLICLTSWLTERWFSMDIGLEVAPFELAGAALGLLLILRTNSGYDRWWEARKLWGGIVNQSRNTAISAVAYGPNDPEWREKFVRWTAAFPHVARCSLRGQPPAPEVAALVGTAVAARLDSVGHMPSYVALRLAEMLRDACERFQLDRFAFLQIDRERALLIDHIGACERILKTPLPKVYSIKIRRFIALFLLTLPFALLHRLSSPWLIPLITIMVAYPLISLDQIGVELQNPFSTTNLSHLPLDDISKTIEKNLRDLLQIEQVPRETTRNELQNTVVLS
jgi:ion channel-forming bestrophin family protein